MGMKVELKQIKCERCGHTWTPRKTDIRMCPKCKTPYFDIPRAISKRAGTTGEAFERKEDALTGRQPSSSN